MVIREFAERPLVSLVNKLPRVRTRHRRRFGSATGLELELITGTLLRGVLESGLHHAKGRPVFDVWGHLEGANVIR
jgi:hypothetical protein